MKKTILFIAILSGLLLSVSSCTTAHHCSAYSQLDSNNNNDIKQNILVNEEI